MVTIGYAAPLIIIAFLGGIVLGRAYAANKLKPKMILEIDKAFNKGLEHGRQITPRSPEPSLRATLEDVEVAFKRHGVGRMGLDISSKSAHLRLGEHDAYAESIIEAFEFIEAQLEGEKEKASKFLKALRMPNQH